MQSEFAKVSGIFVPDNSEVQLVALPKRRRDQFLSVYPDALKLSGPDLSFLLCLALEADFSNKVCLSLDDIARKFQFSRGKVKLRLGSLRSQGVIRGRVPVLLLNPFLVSKCSSRLLSQLRQEWIETGSEEKL